LYLAKVAFEQFPDGQHGGVVMKKIFEKFLIGNVDKQWVSIPSDSVQLAGHLAIPHQAHGLVLITHGDGSHRSMAGHQCVAESLREQGLATLVINLLTPEEEEADLRNRHFRSDVGLLSDRLIAVTDWLAHCSSTQRLTVGYLSTGCEVGAAVMAAIARPTVVKAIASRGGCPELVASAIADVKAPTLLMVGEYDLPGIAINEDALAQLRVEKRLEIIPDASHGFEEAGVLEGVGRLAGSWFQRHLANGRSQAESPMSLLNPV
jgi:dienelactone hydrolase